MKPGIHPAYGPGRLPRPGRRLRLPDPLDRRPARRRSSGRTATPTPSSTSRSPRRATPSTPAPPASWTPRAAWSASSAATAARRGPADGDERQLPVVHRRRAARRRPPGRRRAAAARPCPAASPSTTTSPRPPRARCGAPSATPRGTLDTGEAPLVNDCACCALREDLVPELERLAAGRPDPAGGRRTVGLGRAQGDGRGGRRPRQRDLALTGVITAVDPALLLPYLGNGDDLAEAGPRRRGHRPAHRRRHLGAAAGVRAACWRSPTGDGGRRSRATCALLAQLHPTARQVPVGIRASWRPPRSPASTWRRPRPRQHPACALLPQEADEAGVSTLVWQPTPALPPRAALRARWRI